MHKPFACTLHVLGNWKYIPYLKLSTNVIHTKCLLHIMMSQCLKKCFCIYGMNRSLLHNVMNYSLGTEKIFPWKDSTFSSSIVIWTKNNETISQHEKQTLILPVVWYIYEKWSLILSGQHKLMVRENNLLRETLGPRRNAAQGTEGNYIISNLTYYC